MTAMESQQRADVDISYAVAIGQAKRPIEIASRPANPGSSHRGVAGFSQRHAPAFLAMSIVKPDRRRRAQPNGEVLHPGFVIQEEILDDIALVAETQNEVSQAMVGIQLHNVPENRPASDLHHRLWPDLRFFSQTSALAPA